MVILNTVCDIFITADLKLLPSGLKNYPEYVLDMAGMCSIYNTFVNNKGKTYDLFMERPRMSQGCRSTMIR